MRRYVGYYRKLFPSTKFTHLSQISQNPENAMAKINWEILLIYRKVKISTNPPIPRKFAQNVFVKISLIISTKVFFKT